MLSSAKRAKLQFECCCRRRLRTLWTARTRPYPGVLPDVADDADLVAVPLHDGGRHPQPLHAGLQAVVHVGDDERSPLPGLLQERGQPVDAVVELVVADGLRGNQERCAQLDALDPNTRIART